MILHAHLPFVRHPEHPEFLEEDWLYEAITEVYLPLIFIFQNLEASKVPVRLAINVSPPLCEMLADTLLQERYSRHLANLLELAEKEVARTQTHDRQFFAAAQMYVENLRAAQNLWQNVYRRDLIRAFRDLQEKGVAEIITCGATHGFLPLMSRPEVQRAQIAIAVNNYRKHFGTNPRGIWLPECAYVEGLENYLKEFGIEYFIGDTHAILYGEPRPRYGIHAPVFCPNGTAVFARDIETSQQVWSSVVGYPGNPVYREFYRDAGWDLDYEYVKPHLHKSGERRGLGLKYHAITSKETAQDKKFAYQPLLARRQAAHDAAHFVRQRVEQAKELFALYGRAPLVVSPYDAELYGHWWFEGPQFIDFLFRSLAGSSDQIKAVAPGDYLDAQIPIQTQTPSSSSWGENGYFKVWLNENTSWIYPYQHEAEAKMVELSTLFTMPNAVERRVLNQMARELLLAQSSDWAFQIYQGTTVEYAARRFKKHIYRFNLLAQMIETRQFNEENLAMLESADNIFAEIDYRIYKSI